MAGGKKHHTSLNKPEFLDASLFKYVWSFVPPDTKGLRELNICEKNDCEIFELDLKKWKKCGNIVGEQIFIALTYLFMDFIFL